MRPTALLIALALCGSLAAQNRRYSQESASGGELLPEQAAYDVLRYSLVLRIDPEQEQISGHVEMTAELLAETEELVLHLDGRLKVARCATSRKGEEAVELAFEHEEGLVVARNPHAPGDTFVLRVEYAGSPREAPRPPWDGGFTWARTPDGAPWIATTCQGEGADVWWPCKDHPSDEPEEMDLAITVPKPLVVAANGRFVDVEDADEGWHTWRWHVSTPINNYGVALNIAPYEKITTEFESVSGEPFEFTFWHLPQNREQARAVFPEFQRQMRFFEELCGPYPFRADKYGVAETPHLGMEHQTIIAYGHAYRGDPELGYDYDWLHHHELSHEWWANLVTARDWSDFWIHEGIGTYTQALYLERRFGTEAYDAKMRHDLKRVTNRGTVAPRGARSTQDMYFASQRPDSPDIDVYMKGAWIVHSLRWLVGDEDFFRILRRWAYPDPALEASTDGSACRFATTEELIAIAEEIAGRELDWFFELYLRQPHLPELEVEERAGALSLRWKTPDGLPFPMPVEVRVGESTRRVAMPEGSGELEVGEAEVVVDPRWRVLMVR